MPRSAPSTPAWEEKSLAPVLDAVPLAILLIDHTLGIRWVNEAGEALLGDRREALTGQTIEPFVRGFSTSPQSSDFSYRLRALFQGGDPIAAEEYPCARTVGGRSIASLRITASPIPFAGEKMVLVALEDTTPSEELEAKDSPPEVLGLAIQRARAVTHELNQHLSVLVGNLDLLMAHAEVNGRFRDRINKILKSADRLAEAVRRLQRIVRSPTEADFQGTTPVVHQSPSR